MKKVVKYCSYAAVVLPLLSQHADDSPKLEGTLFSLGTQPTKRQWTPDHEMHVALVDG
jgi:hypothetical protein